MKRLLFFLVFVLGIAACKTYYPPDIDDTQAKAIMLVPGVTTGYTICPDEGNFKDWREFLYNKDVTVSITYVIGALDKPHNIRGTILLTDNQGNELKRITVVPGRRTYSIIFPAKKNQAYYIGLLAKSGCSDYRLSCNITSTDPCAKCGPGTVCCQPTGACCGPGTVCQDGRCVPTNQCNPPCERGQVCEQGVCVWPCGRPCGRGYRCDVRLKRCIRIRRRIRKPVRRPKKINRPHCKAGEVYDATTNTCKALKVSGPTKHASVIRVFKSKNGTSLILNKGAVHGVHVGDVVKIGPYTVKIKSVSATKSVVEIIGKSPDQVTNLKSAIIYLK